MITRLGKKEQLDQTFINTVLDFIVIKRARFSYSGRDVIDYLSRCVCIRSK